MKRPKEHLDTLPKARDSEHPAVARTKGSWRRQRVVQAMTDARGRRVAGGSVHDVSVSVADAVKNAFMKVGGEDYLVWLAARHPQTFVNLLAKTIPSEIKGEMRADGSMHITVETGIARNPTDPPLVIEGTVTREEWNDGDIPAPDQASGVHRDP